MWDMKNSIINCVILLALTSVGPAAAETAEECKNNTDPQKFIDGKCDTLKGVDSTHGVQKEHQMRGGPLRGVQKINPSKVKQKRKDRDSKNQKDKQILDVRSDMEPPVQPLKIDNPSGSSKHPEATPRNPGSKTK